GTVLRKADFTAAYLEGADLTTADFRDANFVCTGTAETRSGLSVFSTSIQPGRQPACTRLQGANITGARLQGANLAGAQLQGATLPGAQIQGEDIASAHHQEARLRNVFVWRADARLSKAKGAWIDMIESEPKQGCGVRLDRGAIGCDWSDVWWSDFKKRIEH